MFRGILDADIILDVLEDSNYSKEAATEALISMCPQTDSSTSHRRDPIEQQRIVSHESNGEPLNSRWSKPAIHAVA